jgi:hypothetical protein
MEETSPIYENVSIPEWANNIRQIKIRELQQVIADKQKEYNRLTVEEGTDDWTTYEIILQSILLAVDIIRLTRKLEILKIK